MTASGGSSFPVGVSNPSLMSSLQSSPGLWDSSRNGVVVGVCARQSSLLGTSAGRAWASNLVFLITFVTLFSSARSQVVGDEWYQNRTALNRQIYLEAFRSLNSLKIKTGSVYNTSLPGNITEQFVETVQMVRLRTGSLRRYGFQFNEITLPVGVRVVQTLRSVVLVYRRFSQYPFYNATVGNVFVSPVVGILVYSASDITNYTDFYRPELTIVSTELPIQVRLESSRNGTGDRVTCVTYNNTVDGSDIASVKNVTAQDFCSWNILGDYSLSAAILPAPKKSRSNTWKIIVGSSVGGAVALLLLLALLILLIVRYRERVKFASMERASEWGEPLQLDLRSRGNQRRPPVAASTRTMPVLETGSFVG